MKGNQRSSLFKKVYKNPNTKIYFLSSCGVSYVKSLVMISDCPIQKTESLSEIRLDWDNRHVRKDNFLFWFFLLFWMAWAPATVFATFMIFSSGEPVFISIWCVFGWLGTLGIPYAMVQRYWSEWIVVSNESVGHGVGGLFATKPKQIPISRVFEIGIGRHDPNDRESVVTLNIRAPPETKT